MRKHLKDAVYDWVRGFNCVHQSLLEKAGLQEITIPDEENGRYYDGPMPMWGWMWSFGDSADDYWLEKQGGLETMSKLGFRVYEVVDEDCYERYFFGIEAAGSDFYEAFWIPLYKARGLKWHDPLDEELYARQDIVLFFPDESKLIKFDEGTGDNLLDEDIENGFVDYINWYSFTLSTEEDVPVFEEDDGGMVMFKTYAQEMPVNDIIKAVKEEARIYSDACIISK